MKISDVNDDIRLQSLNKPVASKNAARETEQITPDRAVSREERPAQQPRSRNKKDRRKGERRKQQNKVLLDTRGPRDRRRGPRRTEEQQAETDDRREDKPVSGIDITC